MEREGKTASLPDYRFYLLDRPMSAVFEFGPEMPARNVTTKMVIEWLANFHERGASTRLPRAILSAAFNRGLNADYDPTAAKSASLEFNLTHNPVTVVGGPKRSNRRNRSLSFEELQQFWSALPSDEIAPGPSIILRMVIAMGGVRIMEICKSRNEWWKDNGDWRTLKGGKLSLPETKNGRPHDLPITLAAKKILSVARPQIVSKNPYLFPSPGKHNEPRSPQMLTRGVVEYCADTEIDHFPPRDIRRTMKTLLLDRDVRQVDIDIWHNHGKNADVARRHCDRSNYEHAKGRVRDAVDDLISETET